MKSSYPVARQTLSVLEDEPDKRILECAISAGAKQIVTGDRALRVLYSSGYTKNAIVHQGRLDAGVELLSKPYTRRELAAKLRKVLQAE